ncbi:hypothetical protein EAG_09795 [Camponotus floridanus]|uniref:Uncharacterized protein n=1 Tax=Camponotus floridanus TaxID=104421 RepID=E2AUS4_CAMFO|nr:hypothetical protein EAG_09795 [Camponotus floridanus]
MYPRGRNSFRRAGQFTAVSPRHIKVLNSRFAPKFDTVCAAYATVSLSVVTLSVPPTPPACSDYGHQPATRDLDDAAPNFASFAGSPSSPLHSRRFSSSYRTGFTLNSASKFDLAEFMTTVTLKCANFQVLHDSREFLLAACRGYSAKRNLRPNEFTSDSMLIRCTTQATKGLPEGCRPTWAKRLTGEKSRKSGAAVGAFIAYGSAKHLWNNGAAKYIVGEEKRNLRQIVAGSSDAFCGLVKLREHECNSNPANRKWKEREKGTHKSGIRQRTES